MTHLVTRCPKCATAFRITTTQLESAKGSVRCGSCLHIFKAHDDLVDTTPKAAPFAAIELDNDIDSEIDKEIEKAFKVEITSEIENDNIDPHSEKAIFIDDDILISDEMNKLDKDPSSYEFEGYMDIDLHPTQTTSLFERTIKPVAEPDADTADESWAEALISLEQEQNPAANGIANKSTPSIPKEHTPSDIDSQAPRHAIDIPEDEEYARINREFSTLYKTPLFNLVNDEELSSETRHKPATEKQQEPADILMRASKDDPVFPEEQHSKASFDKGFFRDNSQPDTTAPQKHAAKHPAAIHAAPESRSALLMNIVPSPIELTAERLRNWSPKALWPGLALTAALILVAQIAYFKFDYLSRIEPYRSGYVWLCAALNCELPSLVDTSQIKPYQLMLRSHPQAANALIADVIIRNDAPFEQPFPDLILVFSTIDNTPVASRRFTPKEYLAGEASGRKHIGSKQPVHITLELSRPAPEAVNYHIDVAH